jgi:effector-binding domain-containing protein
MKVYHDADRRLIVIEGTTETFPERSLLAERNGDLITIVTYETGGTVLGPLPYTYYQDRNGTSFVTAEDAYNYIMVELSKQVPTAERQEEFSFPSAATVWHVNHLFGYRPVVEVRDSAGNAISAGIHHLSSDELEICFTQPMAGSAMLT